MKPTIAFITALLFSPVAALHAAKPNILFIYVEDLGYYTSERAAREPNAGITGLKTPNLDNLAAESVNFTRAFCGQSVCSPSKSAIYSGLLPHTNGIWCNCHNNHPKLGNPDKWIPLSDPITKANDPTNLAAGNGEYGDPGPQYNIDLHDETVRHKDDQPLPYELLRQLCMADAPPEELYDLDTDPWAVKNLFNDSVHAETLARLRKEFTTGRTVTKDNDKPFTLRGGKATE